jgi:hypothetical protein
MGCGTLALALATSAYDTARAYVKERVQGPAFTDRKAGRVPIIEHEDVRRMLMNLKSGTEGMRAMITRLYFLMDVAHAAPDESKRAEALLEVELLTPLVKSYCSDFGYELTREAIQIMGGAGYCREFPLEQYARDLKSISIYEGTTYIQALDLIGRKLTMNGGQVFQDWLQDVLDFADQNKEDADFALDFDLLRQAAEIVGDYVAGFMKYFTTSKLNLIPLAATRFQECMSETFMAGLMLEQGLISRDKLKDSDPESGAGVYYRGKIQTVHYFCRNILTNVFSRHKSFKLEDTSALDIPEAAF